jgi:hypothetical protein
MVRALWSFGCLFLLCAGVAFGQQPGAAANSHAQSGHTTAAMPSIPANQLVAQVVDNELKAKDEGRFMYRDRRQTPAGSKTKEMVETNDGVVARLIAVNDQPLTPAERANENARLQGLISHPDEQRRKKKEQQDDAERVKRMFKELPNAFLYQYDGTEQGKSGELIRLKFRPNPKYDPPNRETSVYKAMDGMMWVDAKAHRLAKIEATLFRDVGFGWGILGHLDKGGHFMVTQSKIGPDRWEATDMNIQFSGKALLFKTINLKQVEQLSDFHPVPENLSLVQGIELLNKNNAQVAENGTSAAAAHQR